MTLTPAAWLCERGYDDACVLLVFGIGAHGAPLHGQSIPVYPTIHFLLTSFPFLCFFSLTFQPPEVSVI